MITLGSSLSAQKAQGATKPDEQVFVKPTTVSWDELMKIQAEFPSWHDTVDAASAMPIEIPPQEITTAHGPKASPQAPPGGGVANSTASCTGFASEPPIAKSFSGQTDDNTIIPPDVSGSVGPTYIMNMLNDGVFIEDRVGGSVVSMSLAAFWSPVGGSSLTYPRVFYDGPAGRWNVTARSGTGGTMSVLLAVSVTDDPTGAWTEYAITADTGGTQFPDWLMQGYNSTWITMTANMFNVTGGAFAGVKAWVADKSTVGGTLTVSVFATGFTTAVHGSGGSSVQPTRALDSSDPNMYLLNDSFTSSSIFLIQITVISGTGAAPVASGIAGSPFGGSTSFCFVTQNFSGTRRNLAQLGDARFLDTFSVRMSSAAVRNGKIWAANHGGLPGPSTNTAPTSNGILWYQVDPTLPFPASSGAPGSMMVQNAAITNGTSTMSAWPSVAVNCADDAIIGFSNSDATIHPQACYTIRLGTDPVNAMGSIKVLKAGIDTYWKNFGVGSATICAWGLYSASTVDPIDDKTLWTLQPYAAARVGVTDNDSRWGTWWGRFGSCGTPAVTVDPSSVIACAGGPTGFSVTATQSAAPLQYQWRKNGVDMPGENAATLSIGAASAGDEASYDVVISDGCGGPITSGSATLALATVPVISDDPDSLTQCTGGDVLFSVTASSNAPLTYQWQKDGSPISGETASTLSLTSITLGDGGSYDCVVSNGCDSVTSAAAVLDAELGPVITDAPDPLTVCLTDPASFSVTANGVFPLQWYKDGVPLSGETGSTLSIPSVSPADIGAYKVEVIGSCGSIFSTPVALAFDTPAISDQPDPVTTCEGSLVILFLNATNDNPLTYQWRKDGVPLTAGHISPVNQDFIAFNALASDTGSYDCVIENGCSPSTISAAALVTVNTFPVITVQPVDVVGHHLQPADLTVTATGIGSLTYQWRFGGVPIPGANSPTLHFNKVRTTDLGFYDVEVSTVCGLVTSVQVELSVDHTQAQRKPVR